MATTDPNIRLFLRVAEVRLADARFLLRAGPPRASAATYLAGYAVECALKVMVLDATPIGRRPEVMSSFRGRSGHDLAALRYRLVQSGVRLPPQADRHLTYLRGIWAVELRYDPSIGNAAEAMQFVRLASNFVEAVTQRI